MRTKATPSDTLALQRIVVGRRRCLFCLSLTAILGWGCGTIQQNTATEQLLASDAVDSSVSRIDFTPLAGQKVFLDTKYIPRPATNNYVAADYIISSLRQAMTAAGIFLQDSEANAEYVVEARVGTLGADGQEMVYGIPASNALSAASVAIAATSQAPAIPVIPEIAFAKKKNQLAAAKIACFAYHRESRERVWQSGLSIAKSTAKDTWILGAGPFQRGSIYDGTGLAGSTLDVRDRQQRPPAVAFRETIVFEKTPKPPEEKAAEVVPAAGEKPAEEKPAEEEKAAVEKVTP